MKFSKAALNIIVFITICNTAKAQLSFPAGSILILNTTNNFLYIETRIVFNTGIYQSDDYKWEKIYDSLDSRWLITACFNGDCKNNLEQNGNFIKDFGLNDTSGFIAFHIETYDYTGISVIKYKVYNKNDSSDKADLIFKISYTKPAGINEPSGKFFSSFPNPVTNELTIRLQSGDHSDSAEIELLNTSGIKVLSKNMENQITETLNVSELSRGTYFIRVKSISRSFTQKFIKQ